MNLNLLLLDIQQLRDIEHISTLVMLSLSKTLNSDVARDVGVEEVRTLL